jgi:hypothetical protein
LLTILDKSDENEADIKKCLKNEGDFEVFGIKVEGRLDCVKSIIK